MASRHSLEPGGSHAHVYGQRHARLFRVWGLIGLRAACHPWDPAFMFASSHPPKVPYSLKPYNFSFTGSVSQSFPHTRASFTKISVKPKMATTGKMQLLGPKFSKMTAPNFLPNPLCGPNTVFQGRWPNQGGTPQDPPKKRQSVAQAAFWS